MSILIDTHCHLDLFKDIQFNKQSEDSQGIKTITVTNAPSFYKPNVKLFDGSTNIRVALGLHPQLVSQYKDELNLFELLIKNVRYVGEIGLDGSSELKNTYTTQKRLLEQILGVCSNYDNKILTIHSRNAASEVIEMLVRCLGKSNCKIILHWYSGGLPELKAAIQKGFYFSINHKMASRNKRKEIIKKEISQKLEIFLFNLFKSEKRKFSMCLYNGCCSLPS